MSTTALALKDVEQKVTSVVEAANSIEIKDQPTYEAAGRFVLEHINPILKELDRTFDPIIDQANKAHKEALAQKKRHYEPVRQAKEIAAGKCGIYQKEQLRIQAEEQRKAEEEARGREEEERVNEAVAAQEAGAPAEEVEAVLSTPLPVVPVRATPTFERIKGLTREKPFSAQVTSMRMLVKFVSENPQHLNLLLPNQPALNSLAKSQQTLLQIPGVQAGRF